MCSSSPGRSVLEGRKHGEPRVKKLKLVKAGTQTRSVPTAGRYQRRYDKTVADLVNYLVYMGEPSQNKRETVGYVVLLFLILVSAAALVPAEKEYWKDVH